MTLSKSSVEMLFDMVENRLSDMVVTDREDAKEQLVLRRTLQELAALSLDVSKGETRRRVGRRPSLRVQSPMMEDTLIY